METATYSRMSDRLRLSSRFTLALGFGGLLVIMALAGIDALRVLRQIRRDDDQIRRQFLSRNHVLNDIRSDLYLSGTYVRDYLLEPEPQRAGTFRASLQEVRHGMDSALLSYDNQVEPAEKQHYAALKTELSQYWKTVDPILAWDSAERRRRGYTFLRDEVFPRRTAMLEIASRIAEINEQQLNAGNERVVELLVKFQNRMALTLFATLALGLGMAAFKHPMRDLCRVKDPREPCAHPCRSIEPGWMAADIPAAKLCACKSVFSINEPGEHLARPLDRSFKGVRVAWFKDLGGVPFDARVRTVVDGHRKTFESLGCIVEQAEPDFAPAEIAFRMLRAWNTANTFSARMHEHPEAFKDTIKGEIEEGQRLTSADLARAETAHGQLWRRFQIFLEKYEYFVLPTTQLPPFDVNTPYPTEIAGVKFDNYIDWMKSCWYISATGNPAASVPGGFTPEGLPVGVQIVGRNKADFSVLQMAHAFEQATGFGKKHPVIAIA